MKEKVKIYKRCQTCTNQCSHEFYLKVLKDKEGYWVGSGIYNTEEEAEQVKQQVIDTVNQYNEKNKA